MKKIAVGDLGEFWYGDYKEPFVELEGSIPGYPRGALLKDDAGRLLCAQCGKTFDNLGVHVAKRHGMSAREYKQHVGLLSKSALVSETGRLVRIRNGLRSRAAFMTVAEHGHKKVTPATPKVMAKWVPEYLNKTGRCYEQVLATARQVIRDRGRLSASALSEHGIGTNTVRAYFGNMKALADLLNTDLARSRYRWTEAELLGVLGSLSRELGRTPTASDIRRYGLPSISTFCSYFGSWSVACQRAGLEPHPRGGVAKAA